MDLLHINGTSDKKQCCIHVSDTDFTIEGDFYYLINKEFRSVKNGKDTCNIKEYMGLGFLFCKCSGDTLCNTRIALILLQEKGDRNFFCVQTLLCRWKAVPWWRHRQTAPNTDKTSITVIEGYFLSIPTLRVPTVKGSTGFLYINRPLISTSFPSLWGSTSPHTPEKYRT